LVEYLKLIEFAVRKLIHLLYYTIMNNIKPYLILILYYA